MDCPNTPQLFDEKDSTVLSVLGALHDFRLFYRAFHKYISMILCLFGLVANCMHIWILTRPRMLQSSVHTVLICIALADIGTMSSYTVYLVRFEFGANSSGGYPYSWILLLKIHVVLSIALHAISLYLLVLLAYIRLCSIRTQRSRLLESRLTGFLSLLIAFFIFTLCIPTLLAHDIQPQIQSPQAVKVKAGEIFSEAVTVTNSHPTPTMQYNIGFSKMFINNDCFLLKLNLWLIGIMMKIVPCLLLLYLTYCLLLKLKETKKKRLMLLRDKAKDGAYKDRTTYMLLLMVSIFLCTELPQGIIAIYNAIYTAQFHIYIYLTIADLLDVLSLINCYVGFTVYFCTCSRYRQTFYSILPHFRFKKPYQLKKNQQGKRVKMLELHAVASREQLGQDSGSSTGMNTTNSAAEKNDCFL